LANRERVNVLGALRHDSQLTWTTQQRPTTRDDVIVFFDQIAAQPHSVPRVVLIDNAGIHKGKPMVPPYSPELNHIEILWEHAKHFWRRFVAKTGQTCLTRFSPW
jgi:transposase